MNTTRLGSRTPLVRNTSSARFMIFCGAPPHFTGVICSVKMAGPPRKARIASPVEDTVSYE
jgi:hypothetical protein